MGKTPKQSIADSVLGQWGPGNNPNFWLGLMAMNIAWIFVIVLLIGRILPLWIIVMMIFLVALNVMGFVGIKIERDSTSKNN